MNTVDEFCDRCIDFPVLTADLESITQAIQRLELSRQHLIYILFRLCVIDSYSNIERLVSIPEFHAVVIVNIHFLYGQLISANKSPNQLIVIVQKLGPVKKNDLYDPVAYEALLGATTKDYAWIGYNTLAKLGEQVKRASFVPRHVSMAALMNSYDYTQCLYNFELLLRLLKSLRCTGPNIDASQAYLNMAAYCWYVRIVELDKFRGNWQETLSGDLVLWSELRHKLTRHISYTLSTYLDKLITKEQGPAILYSGIGSKRANAENKNRDWIHPITMFQNIVEPPYNTSHPSTRVSYRFYSLWKNVAGAVGSILYVKYFNSATHIYLQDGLNLQHYLWNDELYELMYNETNAPVAVYIPGLVISEKISQLKELRNRIAALKVQVKSNTGDRKNAEHYNTLKEEYFSSEDEIKELAADHNNWQSTKLKFVHFTDLTITYGRAKHFARCMRNFATNSRAKRLSIAN